MRVSERLEALERALAQREAERQRLMSSSSATMAATGDPYDHAAVALYASVLETCEHALCAAGEFVCAQHTQLGSSCAHMSCQFSVFVFTASIAANTLFSCSTRTNLKLLCAHEL